MAPFPSLWPLRFGSSRRCTDPFWFRFRHRELLCNSSILFPPCPEGQVFLSSPAVFPFPCRDLNDIRFKVGSSCECSFLFGFFRLSTVRKVPNRLPPFFSPRFSNPYCPGTSLVSDKLFSPFLARPQDRYLYPSFSLCVSFGFL